MARKERWVKKVEQLLRNSGVLFSESPTTILFVSNSSVMCGVKYEDLEMVFRRYDSNADFIVYPRYKSYSFVIFSDVSFAEKAFAELNDTTPENFPKEIALFYVTNLPETERPTSSRNIPRGLQVINDFVTAEEEVELVDLIESSETAYLKNRRVLHFGYEFDYSGNCAVRPTTPIPPLLNDLLRQIQRRVPGCECFNADQITVNVYDAGQGIPPHVDTHSAFEEPILSLSLFSDVVMEFRDCANLRGVTSVLLPTRSLMVMRDAARYRYKHGILSRKHDVNPADDRLIQRQKRISITFRQVRRTPCECRFIEFCDWSRQGRMALPKTDSDGSTLESEYVAKVYEEIAQHFDETRKSNWGAVVKFLNELSSYSVVLDAGCGNGKYLIREDALCKIGVDLCEGLLRLAYERNCCVLRGDALALPFRRNSADAVISIAVIHHFSTRERRLQALRELVRVLRPGGKACVTVWALEQGDESRGSESAYTRMRKIAEEVNDTEAENVGTSPDANSQSANNSRLRVHDGRSTFLQQDMLVPWNCNSKVQQQQTTENPTKNERQQQYLRYYHMFVEGELAGLVEEIAGCRLLETQFEEGNWVVIFQKDQ